MITEIKKGEIYWVNFDPTIGTEIRKIRPALIIFSSEKRVIALPVSSKIKKVDKWQLIIEKLIKDKDGKIIVDQIRSFDRQRLLRKLGKIRKEEIVKVEKMLKEMLFS